VPITMASSTEIVAKQVSHVPGVKVADETLFE
jgi:hypothetical protein